MNQFQVVLWRTFDWAEASGLDCRDRKVLVTVVIRTVVCKGRVCAEEQNVNLKRNQQNNSGSQILRGQTAATQVQPVHDKHADNRNADRKPLLAHEEHECNKEGYCIEKSQKNNLDDCASEAWCSAIVKLLYRFALYVTGVETAGERVGHEASLPGCCKLHKPYSQNRGLFCGFYGSLPIRN